MARILKNRFNEMLARKEGQGSTKKMFTAKQNSEIYEQVNKEMQEFRRDLQKKFADSQTESTKIVLNS